MPSVCAVVADYQAEESSATAIHATETHALMMKETQHMTDLTRWCITHGKPMIPASQDICSNVWIRKKRGWYPWSVEPACEEQLREARIWMWPSEIRG